MKRLLSALGLCLILGACADPAFDAGVSVGLGQDGGSEVAISF